MHYWYRSRLRYRTRYNHCTVRYRCTVHGTSTIPVPYNNISFKKKKKNLLTNFFNNFFSLDHYQGYSVRLPVRYFSYRMILSFFRSNFKKYGTLYLTIHYFFRIDRSILWQSILKILIEKPEQKNSSTGYCLIVIAVLIYDKRLRMFR